MNLITDWKNMTVFKPILPSKWQNMPLSTNHSSEMLNHGDMTVMYRESFWADGYIYRTLKDATMVRTNKVDFQKLCLQML